jgi:hypothetical protein
MTTTTTNAETKSDRIRALNDAFRRTFVGGAVMITAGVEALPLDQRRSLLAKVRAFDVFSEDNDPHAEHDFGAVDEAGGRFFWKLDFYDRNMEFGSPDPADPAVTTRVLTVMRADEY